tara:strand:+ start:546 stop:1265 length:720 start_codon:yes stop_codon:yes gene_type:complete
MELTKKEKEKGLSLPTNLSSGLSYICGVLAGDGSIGVRKHKNEYSIKCVGNPKDEKQFYKIVIKPLFKKLFGIDIKLKHHDLNTTYGFTLYSKSLVKYLTEHIGLPLGRKDTQLRIPRILLNDEELLLNFIRGVFDTDGCMCFKKRYKKVPYYPVISFSSSNELFTRDIVKVLKSQSFKMHYVYSYKMKDKRIPKGYSEINRIELNGKNNLNLWLNKIGFSNPKHLAKIKLFGVKSHKG